MQSEIYGRDYVYMCLPGGAPEKVSAAGDEISQRMWNGWSQCDPPADPTNKKEK